MRLVDVLPTGALPRDECLRIAAALEHASEHPVATALRLAVGSEPPAPASAAVSEPGQGIAGEIGGRRYRIGRPDYALAAGGGVLPDAASGWLDSGDTVVVLADDSGCLALFRLGDELRPEAPALIAALKAAGKEVVLLTGDGPAVARRVAERLGIADVRAGISPSGKHACVLALQAGGAVIAMIGDGVNDAPVLAQAQVSVAMGGGAQLARTQADFVLLSENLDHLRYGLRRADKALRVIRQNLWWSFAYNFVALPLAIAGFVTPWLAGIGMSASSLLVVLNSLRIQRVDTD
jgi:Cu2+-exporting ATPase